MCCVNVTGAALVWAASTMIRSTLAAVGNAVTSFLGGGTVHAPAPPPRNLFLESRQDRPYQHNVAGRLYHYRAPHAQSPLEFRVKYRMDLMGNNITEAALSRALEDHYALFGPIREKYVVFQTGDWTGHFTIDENTDPRTLILRLTQTADDRIQEFLMAPQMR